MTHYIIFCNSILNATLIIEQIDTNNIGTCTFNKLKAFMRLRLKICIGI